jgi:hypothetical protein
MNDSSAPLAASVWKPLARAACTLLCDCPRSHYPSCKVSTVAGYRIQLQWICGFSPSVHKKSGNARFTLHNTPCPKYLGSSSLSFYPWLVDIRSQHEKLNILPTELTNGSVAQYTKTWYIWVQTHPGSIPGQVALAPFLQDCLPLFSPWGVRQDRPAGKLTQPRSSYRASSLTQQLVVSGPLCCDAMLSCRWLPTFRRNMSPPPLPEGQNRHHRREKLKS